MQTKTLQQLTDLQLMAARHETEEKLQEFQYHLQMINGEIIRRVGKMYEDTKKEEAQKGDGALKDVPAPDLKAVPENEPPE